MQLDNPLIREELSRELMDILFAWGLLLSWLLYRFKSLPRLWA